MPRLAAVCDDLGRSTCIVKTSTPWSARLLVASASLTGIDHSPVKMTVQVIFGSTERAPMVKALTFFSTCGIGFSFFFFFFFQL